MNAQTAMGNWNTYFITQCSALCTQCNTPLYSTLYNAAHRCILLYTKQHTVLFYSIQCTTPLYSTLCSALYSTLYNVAHLCILLCTCTTPLYSTLHNASHHCIIFYSVQHAAAFYSMQCSTPSYSTIDI